MSRPAVIIGLGGTGQWVTTYVKKELLEDNKGKLPDNVRLLCFDTWPDPNAGGQEYELADVISVGNTRLEVDVEFVPLAGDTFPKGQQVVDGLAPHIGKKISELENIYTWLDAPYLRQHANRVLWNLNIGAGQIRQFGRLAFFSHATNIKNHLARALTEVLNANTDGKEILVFIVSSFAGGTGAGLFLDMAAMVRSLLPVVQAQGKTMMVRGIFVLPSAFLGNNQNDVAAMQARAYAAWRELGRMMNLGPGLGDHEIKYDDATTIRVDTKPFDQVFMVDANRSMNSFTGIRPEHGVFPSIATFISVALDDDAGDQLGITINNIKTQLNNQLGFSSFGAYTFELPISHLRKEYSLQLTRELLKRWLEPVINNDKEVIDHLYENKNLESPGTSGNQEVAPFMNALRVEQMAVLNRANPAVIEQPVRRLESTRILASIYKRYSSYIEGQYKNKVEEDAKGGYCLPGEDQKINPDTWLGRMLVLADYLETKLMGKDGQLQPINIDSILPEVNNTVRGSISTSRDLGCDPAADESERIISEVENPNTGYIVKHYGTKGGQGSFDRELEVLVRYNAARFDQVLEVKLLNLLNGTVVDVDRGFTGRLGYVKAFLNELHTILEWYQTKHLIQVGEYRVAQKIEEEAEAFMQSEREAMLENSGKKCVFFFNHPKAHQTQEDYLFAAQNYCEVLKDEKLIGALKTLTGHMKDTVNRTKSQVSNWEKLLITDENSLFSSFGTEYEIIKQDLDEQSVVDKSQKLVLSRSFNEDTTIISRIDSQLKKFRWIYGTNGKLNCEVYLNSEYKPLSTEINNDYNRSIFNKVSEIAWEDLDEKKILIKEIGNEAKQQSYLDPNQLGQELIDHSYPMFQSTTPGVGMKTALRKASTKGDVDFDPSSYLSRIDSRSARINPPLGALGYVKSESINPNKITLIQWVDGLKIEDFNIFATLQDAYNQQIRHPGVAGGEVEVASRLHIFPAEANAAFYEHHLPVWLGKGVRQLSPRVVLLLEKIEKVRLFFQSYALGMIVHGKKQSPKTGRWWRLVIPESSGISSQNILFYDSDSLTQPDPFELINDFARGKDIINSTAINWGALQMSIQRQVENYGKSEIKKRFDAQISDEVDGLPEIQFNKDGLIVDDLYRWVKRLETQGSSFVEEYQRAGGNLRQTNPGWSWIKAVDYPDLADVVRMIFIEFQLLNDIITKDEIDRIHAF